MGPNGPDDVARKLDATPLQVALAWLMRCPPGILPILGTCSVAQVEENIATSGFKLPDEDFKRLSEVSPPPAFFRD